jgi:hypothetical protein
VVVPSLDHTLAVPGPDLVHHTVAAEADPDPKAVEVHLYKSPDPSPDSDHHSSSAVDSVDTFERGWKQDEKGVNL